MTELERKIKGYAKAYYERESSISDEEFDKLVEELRAMNPNSECLKVGWGYKPEGAQNHEIEIYDIDEKVKEFELAHSRLNEGDKVQVKLDGCSAIGYYTNGKLRKLLTRGDGKTGSDIKQNINLTKISEGVIEGDGIARFEIVMSLESWKKHYDIEVNTSPRNLITGILGKHNPEDWEIEIAEPVLLDILEGIEGSSKCEKVEEVELKPELPHGKYLTDGYVIKDKNGELKFAYKPQGQSALTRVNGISWQIGQTGKLTPVLLLEPVLLSQAWISRVTGNSIAMMEDMGYGIGSLVKIIRSGEVIPKVIEVVEKSEEYEIPEGSVRVGANLYSENFKYNPSESFKSAFASIKSLGWSIIGKFPSFEKPDDLVDFMGNIEVMEPTDHERKLVNIAIEKIKNMNEVDFWNYCSIPNIGMAAINKILEGDINSLPSHSKKSYEQYGNEILELRDTLKNCGYLKGEIKNKVEKEYKGTVCITGKHDMKRSEQVILIEEKGYKVVDGVDKNTTYLLIADMDSTSSKAVKARKLDIKLISKIDELV